MVASEDPKHGGADFAAPRTRGQRAFKGFWKKVVQGVFKGFIRLESINHERIPLEGPVVIAPSHRSNIDTPIIGAAMKRDSRFMAKESIFKSPFWTRFLVSLGGFPVKRGALDRQTLNIATEVLKRGEMLVLYPEGARQEGPRIKPVFEGAIWLAARAGATIVPAGIGGSHGVMPIGVKVPRPKKVVVVFGEPIVVEDPDRPGKILGSREARGNELREAVQAVFDEAQILAGTPNREWTEDEPGINDRLEPWAD
ncbi:MAG: lysophospholipid acyltransferase family protein [Actinomycetota bacterium]